MLKEELYIQDTRADDAVFAASRAQPPVRQKPPTIHATTGATLKHEQEMRKIIASTLTWWDYFTRLHEGLYQSLQPDYETEMETAPPKRTDRRSIDREEQEAPRTTTSRLKSSRRARRRDRRAGFRTGAPGGL